MKSGARNVPPPSSRVPPSGAQVPPSGPQLHLSRDGRTTGTLKGTGTSGVQPRPASAPNLFGARPTPVPDASRPRRPKKILMLAGLAGLALLSFMIALAASNSGSRRTTPKDAAVVIAEPIIDAPLPLAEPPIDASTEPTIPVDARAAMGLLVVRTIPDGGTVTVGDQVREAAVQPGDPTGARTAQLLLEAGRYTIQAELAGYAPEKRDIVLDGGENKMIEITFTKKVARPDRGQPVGRLTVRTTPWSDVYLGGKKLGQAPFADLEIPVGTHTLTFKNPSRPQVTKTVTIKANKLTKLNFRLP
jgi:serine/threonine-protein kinase